MWVIFDMCTVGVKVVEKTLRKTQKVQTNLSFRNFHLIDIFPNIVQQYLVYLLLLKLCFSENIILTTTTENTQLQRFNYGFGFMLLFFCLFSFDPAT